MCRSVFPRAYLPSNTSDLHLILMRVTYGYVSVLVWRRCDTLCILPVLWMTLRLHLCTYWPGIGDAKKAFTQRGQQDFILRRINDAPGSARERERNVISTTALRLRTFQRTFKRVGGVQRLLFAKKGRFGCVRQY